MPKGTSKKGKKVEAFIQKGLNSNTDGSGIMWKKNGTKFVHIKKGLKTFDDIIEAIEKAKLTEEDELVIHHRIGTCGETTALNTHPFLVSEDIKTMENIAGKFSLPAMAHNGVFYSYSSKNSRYNDTFHFVNEFLALPGLMTLLKERPKEFKDLFDTKIARNKLAFLFPDRDLLTVGDFVMDEGYLHSHEGYKVATHDVGGSSWKRPVNTPFKEVQPPRDYNTWEDYYAEQDRVLANRLASVEEFNNSYNSKAINAARPTVGNKKQKSQIVLYKNDIQITSKNHNHFIFILTNPIKDYPNLTLNQGYAFETMFEDDEPTNFIYEYPNGRELILIRNKEFLENSKYHVKEAFEDDYKALGSLVKHIAGNPSKSVLKKIERTLANQFNKTEVKFKNYGFFNRKDLCYLHRTYSVLYDTRQKLEAGKIIYISDDAKPKKQDALEARTL